jgi:Holliday junction DNA helicase RuvA
MIGFLRGQVIEKAPNRVLVNVNGVGYEVFIPLSTFYDVGDEGSDVALRVHTHVREDALQLFGFRNCAAHCSNSPTPRAPSGSRHSSSRRSPIR